MPLLGSFACHSKFAKLRLTLLVAALNYFAIIIRTLDTREAIDKVINLLTLAYLFAEITHLLSTLHLKNLIPRFQAN